MMIPILIRTAFRRLWERVTARYSFFASLSILAVFIQMKYRVPGKLIFFLLPVISVALTGMSLLFLMVWIVKRASPDDPVRRLLQRIDRVVTTLVFLFFAYSVFLYANGRFDQSLPVEHAATVVRLEESEFNFGSIVPIPWAELSSWKGRRSTERLLLSWSEEERLWPGQPVLIHIRQGAYGIPWIFKLERDKEKYYQKILQEVPTAAETWKDLINFHLDHKKWKEAGKAAREYSKIYPTDYDFMKGVAAVLGQARQEVEAVPLLEPFLLNFSLSRQEQYELYNIVGWGHHRLGNNNRAVELLKTSIPFNPESYWAYYHLGYLYSHTGKEREAVEMFEEVLKRRPGFPEIEGQIARLEKIMASAQIR